eukprot:12195159-Alexandrium_andersonii.AAC.1
MPPPRPAPSTPECRDAPATGRARVAGCPPGSSTTCVAELGGAAVGERTGRPGAPPRRSEEETALPE